MATESCDILYEDFVWGGEVLILGANDWRDFHEQFCKLVDSDEEYIELLQRLLNYTVKMGWHEFQEFLNEEFDLTIHALEGETDECSCSKCHEMVIEAIRYEEWERDFDFDFYHDEPDFDYDSDR